MTIREYVGKRIHLYRVKQNLTLEQLGILIGKSPSTISKYELGKVSIDLDTLSAIANALKISIQQLVDKPTTEKKKGKTTTGGYFTTKSRFYIYQYFTPMKKLITCVIDVIPDATSSDDRIMFYYDVPDYEDPTNANFLYEGRICYYDAFATMKLINLFSVKDEVFIYAKNPLWIRNTTTGLMMFLSQTLGNPSVAKILISSEILQQEVLENDTILDILSLSNKEVFSAIKRTNCLMLIDTWEKML